jgi:hypothetical protein
MEVSKRRQLIISKDFAALANLDHSGYINKAYRNIRNKIKISAKDILDQDERKQHKPWFDEKIHNY